MSAASRARAARALLTTLPLIMRNVGGAMRESGGDMTPQQHRLLTMIASHPKTLSQLADIQGVTPATATTLVTTLENRGWVRRDHDVEDRRKVVVTLSDAGREHLVVAQEAAEGALAQALASLGDEDLDRLVAGLAVLQKLPAPTRHHCSQQSSPSEPGVAAL